MWKCINNINNDIIIINVCIIIIDIMWSIIIINMCVYY